MTHIDIKIEYKLINSSQWQSIDFLPGEYFNLDPNEKFKISYNLSLFDQINFLIGKF